MSFLKNYSIYTGGNEAPKIFHYWSGMVALSAIVSRRVYLHLGYFDIQPNLYVVLVGTPGTKKTTAMNSAKDLIYDLKDIPFSAECITKQAICQHMALNCAKTYTDSEGAVVTYTPYSIFATELSHFLGMGTAKEMVDFLTTIYDQRFYESKTKNKGTDVIIGPYITLLACTTPDWIRGWMREDVITGGFSRRALFVNYTGARERIPRPVVTPEMIKAREACLIWARRLMQVQGEFSMSPEAIEFYDSWYKGLEIPQNYLAGYFESKHVQLLKSAMLISLSESVDLKINKSHLELALAALDETERDMAQVFEGIGRNELNLIAAKLLEILHFSEGVMAEKQLRLVMYREADADELAKVLVHLEQTDRIKILSETRGGVTRKLVALKEKADQLIAGKPAS